MGKQGLNFRQERFVQEYLVSGNGTDAARRAGYSPKTAKVQAHELLTNPNVVRAIEEGRAEIAARGWLTMEWVINGLKDVVERSLQRKPVMTFDQQERRMVQATDEDGEGVWQFDSQGANRALELLGKTMGGFTDKVSTKDETLAELSKFLSDELG